MVTPSHAAGVDTPTPTPMPMPMPFAARPGPVEPEPAPPGQLRQDALGVEAARSQTLAR